MAAYKVAIVGAGPAGYFAAQALQNLANDDRVFEIDMIERLPTPWGIGSKWRGTRSPKD